MLPFANITGDHDQEYLADGIVEDVITALSKFRWLLVIPARKKADSEGLRRFESDGVDSSFAEHVVPSPMIELIRGGGAWLRFRSKRG